MTTFSEPAVTSAICTRMQSELVAFLDGELLPAEAARVEAHLAECPACAATRDALSATLRLADAWTATPETDVVEAVLQAIAPKLPEVIRTTQTATAVEVFRARAEAEGVAFIDLNRHKPEPKAIPMFSGAMAREFQAMPIRRDGATLFVAMSNPRDIRAVDAIRMATRCMVRPMLADPALTDAAIALAYPLPLPSPPLPTAMSATDELLDGMRALQRELSSMRQEIADLRRQLSAVRGQLRGVPPRPDTAGYLFPFAAPSGLRERD